MNKNKEILKKEVIDFLKKEYAKSGRVPSGREIESKFNIHPWFHFTGGLKGIYKLCGFNFTPKENKQKLRRKFYLEKRNKERDKIIDFFLRQIKKGVKPTNEIIQKGFSIRLTTYFSGGIRELYKITKVDPPVYLRDRKELQEEIIKYIQSQVKKGFYPTYNEIEEKFQTNIRNSGSIKNLYQSAGVEYKRDPNPFLRYKKEKKLAKMTEKLFVKLGYKIKNISIGPSKPNGADIIVEDKKKRLIPVEIKAFQKFGKIGHDEHSPYIRDEILQLKRYIKNLHAPYGYLVTSTDRKTFKTRPSDIKILFGKDLRKLLLQFKMYKEIKDLDWIRNSSISYDKEEIYRKIRDDILKYTERKLKEGKYVPRREISERFEVNPDSYFPKGTREIYEKLGLDPELIPNYRMSRNFDKEKFKKRIITFVKEENEKGHFPTHKEIQRKFRCLVKLHFPGGIREIAKSAGIKYNRKFATKTPEKRELIRQKIIKYAVQKLKSGFYPGYRDVESKFHINFQYYFKNPEELYQKAGYNGPIKKTWKNSGKKPC